MALLNRQVYSMGPLLRLQWEREGEAPEQVKARGSLWLERGVLESLRRCLIPAQAPPDKPHVHGSSCWLWTGSVDGEGKGIVYNQDKGWTVHRLLYTIQHGPLSERTLLYSTCGVARCVNPLHHTAVDRGPIRRPRLAPFTSTQYPRCKYGHALSPENTYLFQGKPMCRDCRAAAQARYRLRAGPPRGKPSSGPR